MSCSANTFRRALLTIGVLMSAGVFAVDVPDGWITTKTKIALLTTAGVRATSIDVDTLNGTVTLHGAVRSAEEKTLAEAVASRVDGVRAVHDDLEVASGAPEKAIVVSDPDLKTEVSRALQDDPDLSGGSIAVQSVDRGVVLLSGWARTPSDHLHALEIAAAVPGVRRVATEIESPARLAGVAMDEDRPNGAPPRSGTVEDMLITAATKLRLLADRRTPSLDIKVDTRKGVVTLFGIVASRQARSAAEEDARRVSGVAGVRDELEIVPTQHRYTVDVDDEDIEKTVKRALDARSDLRDLGIGIEVRNGVVRLSGTVPSQGHRVAATTTAQNTMGVRSVLDDLRVSATATD